MKYECPYCGIIESSDVVVEEIIDLEPMGDAKVERRSYVSQCGFCGTDDIWPFNGNYCISCEE